MSPTLLLGPLLRYVDATEATVWVETDTPCDVRVLDTTEPTFTVAGHHYALLMIDGLEPGTTVDYTRLPRRRAGMAGRR